MADVDELAEEHFQFGGEAFDFAVEKALGDDARHGDGESEDGGVESNGDALSDDLSVAHVAGFAHFLEQKGEATCGAKEAE